MTTTAPNHPTHPASNHACHHPISKRHPVPKLVDPLEIVTLVVAGPRRNGKFVCPLCANNFGRRCELKRHIAEVHTINGARRFTCNHLACGKTFTRKDALAKHHLVKHQGKKPFVCPTCSEKFTTRYDLSRHNIRVHSNVKKRFTCQFCSAGFSQKSQLTMHKGRVHSSSSTQHSVPPPCPRPSSMDSLAAAAIAIAAEEDAAEQKRQTHTQDDSKGHSDGTGLKCGDVSEGCVINVAKVQEANAETLAAEALLEAGAIFGGSGTR